MTRGTVILVVVALASLGGAVWMAPEELPPSTFEDTGEPLFADFADPTTATSLEVVTWNEDATKVQRFKVEQKEGRWVIPSHHDYPADATEQMGKAAASFIGVKRDIYYGDKVDDHASHGLIDPEEADAEEGERGKRFTLKDANGTVLVDILVGKAVPDKQGFHYVRFPGEKRVYGSRLELDISTEFTDWIEKDLLRLERDDITTLVYDPYQVDEARGQVRGSDPMGFERKVTDGDQRSSDWTLAEGKMPQDKEVDSAKIRQMIDAIDRLKIVGVRPRPQRLTLAALQKKGFFVTSGGKRLFGNEGEVQTITKDGIVYTLYFGEITFESGLALTSGKSAGREAGDDSAAADSAEEKDADDRTGNRYLFVNVKAESTPDLDAEEKKAEPADQTVDAGAEKKSAEVQRAEQRKRVVWLQRRFNQWFFVISDSSFKQIHKPRSELFKDIKAE